MSVNGDEIHGPVYQGGGLGRVGAAPPARVVASTLYDLPVLAELLADGSVRVSWVTNGPIHDDVNDEGSVDDLSVLDDWVCGRLLGELAALAEGGS